MSPRSRLGAEMWCLGLSSSLLKAGRPSGSLSHLLSFFSHPLDQRKGPKWPPASGAQNIESGGYAGESHRVGGLLCSSGVSHLPLESFAQPCLGPGSSLPK